MPDGPISHVYRETNKERGIRHGEVALQQWLTSWYERLLSFSTVDKHTTHKSVYPHKTQTRKKQEKTYYYLCDLFRWEVKLNTHTHTRLTVETHKAYMGRQSMYILRVIQSPKKQNIDKTYESQNI